MISLLKCWWSKWHLNIQLGIPIILCNKVLQTSNWRQTLVMRIISSKKSISFFFLVASERSPLYSQYPQKKEHGPTLIWMCVMSAPSGRNVRTSVSQMPLCSQVLVLVTPTYPSWGPLDVLVSLRNQLHVARNDLVFQGQVPDVQFVKNRFKEEFTLVILRAKTSSKAALFSWLYTAL